MKKTALIISGALALFSSSCMKKRTCTCRDADGKVIYEITTKTPSKSSIEQFESDCKKRKVRSGTKIIPCELS